MASQDVEAARQPLQSLQDKDGSSDRVDTIGLNAQPKLSGPEEPKVVLQKSWKSRIASWPFHLIPLGVCIFLLYLDFTQYFWYEKDNSVLTNGLQFPAKLLELAILASLSAMALHHARRHLLSVEGIPFGLLSASYRIADVQLLLDKSFWRTICLHSTWRLGIFVLLGVLYSVLVGPSTAIALLPSAGYYPYSNAFANSTGKLLFLSSLPYDPSNGFNDMLKYVWPAHLNKDIVGPCAENDTSILSSRSCARGTLDSILEWAWEEETGQVTSVFEPNSRFAYHAISSAINTSDSTMSAMAAGSVSSEYLVQSLGLLWRGIKKTAPLNLGNLGPVMNTTKTRFSRPKNGEAYQPIVQTRCDWFGDSRRANTTIPQLQANGLLNFDKAKGWQAERNASWPVPKTAVDNLNRRVLSEAAVYSHYIEWIQPRDIGAGGRFSIAALISSQVQSHEESELNDKSVRLLTTCVFNAHWVPSTFVLDPSAILQVDTNWTAVESDDPNPLAAVLRGVQEKSSAKISLSPPLTAIEIDADWAEGFNGAANNTVGNLLNDPLATNPDNWDYPYSNSSDKVDPARARDFISGIAPTFNTLMTVGLANSGVMPKVFFSGTDDPTTNAIYDGVRIAGPMTPEEAVRPDGAPIPLKDIYTFNIAVERFGYAYGARTGTVFFARSILLIYIAVLVAYSLYALKDQLRSHPFSVTSWGSLTDLVALAWNSAPPGELKDCGAGIEQSETWQNRVRIRAKADDRLEMVLHERPDLGRLEPGVKYG